MTADPIMLLLRAERKARGLTQRDLAVLIGTKQSAVSEWETGVVSPELASVRRIAEALGAELHASKRLGL